MKKLIALAATVCASLGMGAAAQYAHIYTTTPDGLQRLAVSTVESTEASESAPSRLNLTATERNRIDGFGYAITYSAAYNLRRRMTAKERANLLRRTFSKTEGYGASYVRVPIGTCDFSSHTYSLCDTHGPASDPLQNFAFTSDELNYIIPVLQEITAINPDLHIIASPWSPPRWMKTNNDWKGGNLKTDCYDVYAQYFVRFINGMALYGINIDAVTIQNESLARGNTASMYMPWDEAADFVKTALAPTFKNSGLTTKIYVFDHNYNYDNVEGQDDYPAKLFERMGTGFDGEELVAGVAWHNYSGNPGEISDIAGKLPGKDMIFTESTLGLWNNGNDLSQSLCKQFNDLIIETVRRGCVGSVVWNFMLDEDHGPYTTDNTGGCYNAYCAVDINTADRSVSYNSHYYAMSLASLAARQGAHRVDTSGWWADKVSYLAFLNTDGTYSMVFSNSGESTYTINIIAAGRQYTVDVVPGVRSILLGQGTAQPHDPSTGEYDELTEHTIYFDNSATAWLTSTIFSWGNPYFEVAWPGSEMQQHRGSIYKISINADHHGLVFHAGDGDPTKTADMTVYHNNIYSAAGNRGVYDEGTYLPDDTELRAAPRYISGSFNSWSIPTANDKSLMSVDNGKYTVEATINGNGRFCIYGAAWNPKYCKISAESPAITGPVTDYPVRLATDADKSDTDINYSGLEGDYKVTFDPLNLTVSLQKNTATSVADIIDTTDESAVYYNLQGQPVANPVPGNPYIRKRGVTATRIIY